MIGRLVGSDKELEAALAAGQSHIRVRDGAAIRCDVRGDVTLLVGGPARAELHFVARSSLTVICSGRARVGVVSQEESKPRIQILGRADVTARCYGASSPEFQSGDYGRLMLEAFDASSPTVAATDFASYMVLVHDQARPYCSDWSAGWQARVSDIYIGQHVFCHETENDAMIAARELFSAFLATGSRYAACTRVRGAVPRLCRNVVDIRWTDGTVHVELQDEDGQAWYSVDAHDRQPLTGAERNRCTRRPLEPAPQSTPSVAEG